MGVLFANGNAVGGITFVTVNGNPLLAVSDVHYQGALISREDANGMDGPHGFTEKVRTPSMKGRFRIQAGLDVASLQYMTGIQVIMETNAGVSISGSNMWAHEIGEVDTAEGVFDAEWHSPGPLTLNTIAPFNLRLVNEVSHDGREAERSGLARLMTKPRIPCG